MQGSIPALATALLLGCASPSEVRNVKERQPVPDFSLPGSDGKTYKLSDYRGKRAVVIAWFPAAFTGG